MKKITIMSIMAVALLVVGAIGVMAYENAKVIDCNLCGGECNAEINCGNLDCAAVAGTGSCSCSDAVSNEVKSCGCGA